MSWVIWTLHEEDMEQVVKRVGINWEKVKPHSETIARRFKKSMEDQGWLELLQDTILDVLREMNES